MHAGARTQKITRIHQVLSLAAKPIRIAHAQFNAKMPQVPCIMLEQITNQISGGNVGNAPFPALSGFCDCWNNRSVTRSTVRIAHCVWVLYALFVRGHQPAHASAIRAWVVRQMGTYASDWSWRVSDSRAAADSDTLRARARSSSLGFTAPHGWTLDAVERRHAIA